MPVCTHIELPAQILIDVKGSHTNRNSVCADDPAIGMLAGVGDGIPVVVRMPVDWTANERHCAGADNAAGRLESTSERSR